MQQIDCEKRDDGGTQNGAQRGTCASPWPPTWRDTQERERETRHERQLAVSNPRWSTLACVGNIGQASKLTISQKVSCLFKSLDTMTVELTFENFLSAPW